MTLFLIWATKKTRLCRRYFLLFPIISKVEMAKRCPSCFLVKCTIYSVVGDFPFLDEQSQGDTPREEVAAGAA